MADLLLPGVVGCPDDRDSVYTPPRLAAACVQRLLNDGWLVRGALVVEPSVGGGAFARALTGAGCQVIGVDADPDATGGRWCDRYVAARWEDAWPLCRDEHPAAVVGNPPFGGPRDSVPYVGAVHVELARRVASVVAMLLPAAWAVYRSATEQPDPWTLFGSPPTVVYPVRARAFGAHLREAALFVWERRVGLSARTEIGEDIASPVGWLA